MKKKRIPDKATLFLMTSFKKRSVVVFHDCDGTIRRTSIGFFDSSLILAIENVTALERKMTNVKEYQKYTIRHVVG